MDCILQAVARWAVAGGCVLALVGQTRAVMAQVQFAAPVQGASSGTGAWSDDRRHANQSELRLVSHEEQQSRRSTMPDRAAAFDDDSADMTGRHDSEVRPATYQWHPTPQPVQSRPVAVVSQALATEDRPESSAVRHAVGPASPNRQRGAAARSSMPATRTSGAAPMTVTTPPRLRRVADERRIEVPPRGPYLAPASDPLAPWQQRPGGHRSATARRVQYELPPQMGEPMLQPQPELEYVEGQMIDEGMMYDGETGGEYGPDGFPMEYGGASCGHDYHGWHRCTGACCPYAWLDESSLFLGVQGFKNPTDLGRNGNFGFQEGLNFSGAFWNRFGVGYQVGARFAQSNLSGSQTSGALDHTRDQVFVTAGLFQRAFQGDGFQWGAVFDWLEDQYYVDNNFNQVRAEASYLMRGNEIGFWGAFGTSANKPVLTDDGTVYFRTTDMYAFFYRRTLSSGGQGRLWGGFTGNKDGLLGADFRVPCSNNFDLIGSANYVIPMQGPNSGGSSQEGWNLTMNFVWYPTRPRCGTHNGPYRQLFGVADNGTFVLDRTN